MSTTEHPIRIFAWGNRGRRDDGVALILAERLEAAYAHAPEVIIGQYHQLGPELAEELHHARLALFLDAHARDEAGDVLIEPVQADHGHGLDTHHCRPGQLLALAVCLGWTTPPALQIGIRAFDIDFGDNLSPATTSAMLDAERRIHAIVAAARARCGEASVIPG